MFRRNRRNIPDLRKTEVIRFMKVETLGEKGNPVIIMIPGMFCTSEMTAIIGRYFEKDHYVILPTLDGHYKENPHYVSKQQDSSEMLEWLHNNDIHEIELLQGTSMGAEVALEIAADLDIPVKHYLYDGGPFFYFPRFVRAIMCKKFMVMVNKASACGSQEEAEKKLLNDPFVKKLGGDSLESYHGMLAGFATIGQWIDKKSVRAISDTCYKCDLPDLSDEVIRKTTFLFSEKEPARQSEKRLKRRYPKADYYIAKGYGHGGFQIQDPDKYAEYIRKMIKE